MRSSGAAGHLLVFQDRDRDHAFIGIVSSVIADDDAACRQIESCGKRRRRGDDFESSFQEILLDDLALGGCQAGVVESNA